jgi:hypothetical protein
MNLRCKQWRLLSGKEKTTKDRGPWAHPSVGQDSLPGLIHHLQRRAFLLFKDAPVVFLANMPKKRVQSQSPPSVVVLSQLFQLLTTNLARHLFEIGSPSGVDQKFGQVYSTRRLRSCIPWEDDKWTPRYRNITQFDSQGQFFFDKLFVVGAFLNAANQAKKRHFISDSACQMVGALNWG